MERRGEQARQESHSSQEPNSVYDSSPQRVKLPSRFAYLGGNGKAIEPPQPLSTAEQLMNLDGNQQPTIPDGTLNHNISQLLRQRRESK